MSQSFSFENFDCLTISPSFPSLCMVLGEFGRVCMLTLFQCSIWPITSNQASPCEFITASKMSQLESVNLLNSNHSLLHGFVSTSTQLEASKEQRCNGKALLLFVKWLVLNEWIQPEIVHKGTNDNTREQTRSWQTSFCLLCFSFLVRWHWYLNVWLTFSRPYNSSMSPSNTSSIFAVFFSAPIRYVI